MSSNRGSIGTIFSLTLISLAISSTTLSNTARAAEKKSEADSRLKKLLQEWKKADQEVRELHCTFGLTTQDRILRDIETTQVEVFFHKPDLVRVDFKDKKGKLSQIWVCKSKTIRIYDFENQSEGIGPIDVDGSADWVTNLLSSFFQAVQWAYTAFPFDVTEKSFYFNLNKEDKNWAYIQLKPRNPQEFPEFKELEVVLNQKTHLVRQARWLTSAGNRVILDFAKVEINPTPPITWESISKDLPHGWGKGSNRKKQKLNSAKSPLDPHERMHELLHNSDNFEDLLKIEEAWERIWYIEGSKGERIHGGIE